MAETSCIEQVCTGMLAISSDGKRLGKITQIHARDTETYLEVTPPSNLWKPWQLLVQVTRLFLPGIVVVDVVEQQVYLAMDATTAKVCTHRPNWIPREVDYPPTGS